ncbi:MAG: hypothetical protein J4N95_06090 [Chloroflexi bacterium]|nr:hypothetical protein [Chloroflexota bacterium]MCI0889501.1 hypothetical protein [Chloroflexota bacterium]
MPVSSTPKEFTDAINERRSRTTKALDKFIRLRSLKNHPHIADLRTPGYLNKTLPKWIRDELGGLGVKKTIEFTHMNQWPRAQKEEVRKALVHAIDHGLRIDFFWALWNEKKEGTVIEPKRLPKKGKITITFYSPNKNVRTVAGQIIVDVAK